MSIYPVETWHIIGTESTFSNHYSHHELCKLYVIIVAKDW
jgi:hypothetical protein